MNKRFLFISVLLLFFLIILVFKTWFSTGLLSSTDVGFNSKLTYNNYFLSPYGWQEDKMAGLGGNAVALLWIYTDFGIPITILGKIIGLNWNLVERMIFFYPFLILSFLSSAFLFKKIFKKNVFYLLSVFLFLISTYILMVIGGGQVLIALAYAISPLVLYSFIKLLNKISLKKSFVTGLILSLQIITDIRIAYVTLIAVGIYWIIKLLQEKDIKYFLKSVLFVLIIPGLLSFLLNAFWLLPTIINHQNPLSQLGSAFTTTNAVQYFSFAKFENTIALLHPNWPENMFGKVYFMRPEFLILPVLAFASLLFVTSKKLKTENLKHKNDLIIIFFVLLGLIGAFLAKGSNDPFGGIYLWMFNHVPGFVMFRDSTKFYLLVAISYSILIPFSVSQIYEFIKRKTENLKLKIMGNLLPKLFIFLVLGYMLFLIRPAIMGQLGGTFKTTTVPAEYTKLEQFLSTQNNFSRTLWVPTTQRFSFYSPNHPEIPAQDLFSIYDNVKLIQKLSSSEKLLQESGVRYVIVPYDSQGEIFLSDRKYDNKVYLQTVAQVRKISWLMPVSGFGKIAVFAVPNAKDHFYITDKESELTYRYISPVEYSLSVANAKRGDRVVFAESFDGKWVAESSSFKLKTEKLDGRFNSFVLPKDGDYNLRIYYTPQDYVNIGVVISIVTLVGALSMLIVLIIKKK
jgi:hypothetical protein